MADDESDDDADQTVRLQRVRRRWVSVRLTSRSDDTSLSDEPDNTYNEIIRAELNIPDDVMRQFYALDDRDENEVYRIDFNDHVNTSGVHNSAEDGHVYEHVIESQSVIDNRAVNGTHFSSSREVCMKNMPEDQLTSKCQSPSLCCPQLTFCSLCKKLVFRVTLHAYRFVSH